MRIYRPGSCSLRLARATGVLLALAACLPGAPALATAPQDHAQIRAAAILRAVAIGRSAAPDTARVNAEAGSIDPRLRLVACPGELEALGPPTQRVGARMSISVRCPTAGWSVYVPVQLRIEAEVVVLKVPVSRGSRLTAAQLALETRDVTAMQSGYLRRIEDAEQYIARRTLSAGTIVDPQSIELPALVQRGQRVRLIADSSGFAVEAEGEALGEAARGERVKARNLRTKAVVEGWVDESGNVRIGVPSGAPASG